MGVSGIHDGCRDSAARWSARRVTDPHYPQISLIVPTLLRLCARQWDRLAAASPQSACCGSEPNSSDESVSASIVQIDLSWYVRPLISEAIVVNCLFKPIILLTDARQSNHGDVAQY